MSNRFQDTKVKDIVMLEGVDGGVVIGVQFEKQVEVSSRNFVFPLTWIQFARFMRMAMGRMSQRMLDELKTRIVKPYIHTGELPLHKRMI